MKPHAPQGPLTGRDHLLVAALACGCTQEEAATATGLSRSTIQRRVHVPEFVAAVERARDDLVSGALGRAASKATVAVNTLIEIAEDVTAPHQARVSAARAVLDVLVRLREHSDLTKRIEAIETLVEQPNRLQFPATASPLATGASR